LIVIICLSETFAKRVHFIQNGDMKLSAHVAGVVGKEIEDS